MGYKDQQLYLNEPYAKAIFEAGGLPILLPIGVESDIEQLLTLVDGVLLTGGYDIHPFYYQEEPYPGLGEVVPERDVLEITLTKKTIEKRKPFLGLCRGHQVLNVALGGTLYQDLSGQFDREGLLQHSQKAARGVATHSVEIVAGSVLEEIMGATRIAVNSFHHQAVKKVASSLRVVASSSDGVVEALVHEKSAFCVSVQWHPEEQAVKGDLAAKKLFEAFVNACRKKM